MNYDFDTKAKNHYIVDKNNNIPYSFENLFAEKDNEMEQRLCYKDNNITLWGLLNINNNNKSIVVICHARYSSKNSNATTRIAEELNKNKINNFRFDFVACGESSGNYQDYTISNMISNLHASLDMLKSKYNFENFILIGCSMGARIVSLVDYKKYNIEKLVLWYGALNYKNKFLNLPSKKEKMAKRQGYVEIENNNKLSYEFFKDERKYNAYKRLLTWDIEKLFIHGDNDSYVNVNNSINISKKCKNSKLVIIKNGNHGFHNDKCMKEALDYTINFIKKGL